MEEISLLTQMESILRQELEAYRSLLLLSEKQMLLLKEGEPDTEAIAALMDQKIQTMHAIHALDPGHRAIRERWEQQYTAFAEDQRKPIAALKHTLLSLLGQLKTMEDQIAARIQQCEKEISRQLKLMYQGRSANKAYFKFHQGPPRYLDKKK